MYFISATPLLYGHLGGAAEKLATASPETANSITRPVPSFTVAGAAHDVFVRGQKIVFVVVLVLERSGNPLENEHENRCAEHEND